MVAEVGKLEAEAGEECHFDGEKGRGLKSDEWRFGVIGEWYGGRGSMI